MRGVVSLFLCAALAGCTTFQPVREFDSFSIAHAVEPGDEVVVTTATGTYRFTVTAVEADQLRGSRAGRRYVILFRNVRELDVRRVDIGESAVAAGSTLFSTIAAVAAVGAIILAIFIIEET